MEEDGEEIFATVEDEELERVFEKFMERVEELESQLDQAEELNRLTVQSKATEPEKLRSGRVSCQADYHMLVLRRSKDTKFLLPAWFVMN